MDAPKQLAQMMRTYEKIPITDAVAYANSLAPDAASKAVGGCKVWRCAKGCGPAGACVGCSYNCGNDACMCPCGIYPFSCCACFCGAGKGQLTNLKGNEQLIVIDSNGTLGYYALDCNGGGTQCCYCTPAF